jgi:pimeloyl-ACP methyl ester carboxylesterase
MGNYTDEFWTSRDELKLHYRDYPARPECADRPPILCLPGLTRNARDFEVVADRLAGDWRLICPEMRGRGDSAYAKDSATYNPLQYVQDVTELLDQEGIERFVAFGTSLGGMMTMLMSATMPQRIAGALLNDIGPEIEAEGLARIGGYVGQGRSFPTWMHAARALEEGQGLYYPDFEVSDWLAMAKRLMTVGGSGRIVFDYDMKIAEPFREAGGGGAPPDMWSTLVGLKDKPLLLVRGELSDVLSEATLARMVQALPQAEAVSLPRVGHAPTLDEPEVSAAILRLLAKI